MILPNLLLLNIAQNKDWYYIGGVVVREVGVWQGPGLSRARPVGPSDLGIGSTAMRDQVKKVGAV